MSDDPRISPQDAQAKIEQGYAYVDVRTEEEFSQGHPKGAVNVPFLLASFAGMTPNSDFVKVMAALFAKDAKIVVGCKSGGRSQKAREALLRDGFTDVLDQRAGWDGARNAFGQVTEPGWSRAGLPTETGATEGRTYEALKNKVK
jgi:rhodanese-related sulfurtransferase